MMHWFHKKLKPIGRGTLALAGLLWLIAAGAPCVMALTPDWEPTSSHCPEHAKHKGVGHSVMPDCGPVTAVNCQLPDTGTPLAANLGDFAMTPVLLSTLPLPLKLFDNGQRQRHDFLYPDNPSPPLYIQHLTLIL
ncbi:MAG: hypothetical protein NUV51_02740 [Sulfuricaulis sp.]|nr:hypothetical protein [Sulfuricaulis sp.]